MPRFIYKAKKSPTEIIDGTIEADSVDSAIDKIMKLGYVPLDVLVDTFKGRREIPAVKKAQHFSLEFFNRTRPADVSLLTRQLADLVDAGVPLLRALSVAGAQTKNPLLKEIVQKMRDFVEDGGTLSDAMAEHPHIFSTLFINMVKSGEVGGNLNVVLNRMADFIDKDLETKAKVQSSLVYPALIFVVGCLTIFVLLSFVVPRLTVIFDDLAESLPLPTVILIAISNVFAKFWWLLLAVTGLLLFYFQRFISSSEGKLRFDKMKLKLPVLGNFIQEVEVGRFARTLATLLDSGVVIVAALESVWAVLDNEVMKQEVQAASKEVAGGASVTIALKQCAHFPEIAINMIAVGEESGRLEQSLYKLADSYERQSDRSVKVVTSLLEPLMIVVVGGIVFFIVMAVVLPIFKMNQVIR